MKLWQRIKSEILHKGIYCFLVLLIAVGLKYFYSQAGSEDLGWILSPTTGVVQYISGTHFEKEVNVGYVSAGHDIAVVPACAGLNFMIAAFCMAALWLLHSAKKKVLLPFCIICGLLTSYLLTVTVNSLRIAMAMYLYKANIYSPLVTPERVHRIEGVVIYVVFLFLFYFALRKITSTSGWFAMDRNTENRSGMVRNALFTSLVPLFWYFLIILAAPVVNNAHHHNAGIFWEHCLTVLMVGLMIFLIIFLVLICYSFFINKKSKSS